MALPAVAALAQRHHLFVYGTLKQGFTNYQFYLSKAVARGGSTFIAKGNTMDLFPLVVGELQGKNRSIPYLLFMKGLGHHVEGEIYEVDDATLAALDVLEGLSSGHYFRDTVPVVRKNDGAVIDCQIYFRKPVPELLALPVQQVYSDELHALYRPPRPEPDPTILSLIEGQVPA